MGIGLWTGNVDTGDGFPMMPASPIPVPAPGSEFLFYQTEDGRTRL